MEKNISKSSLVLIVMSTYNGENYLKDQLDSLFSQTYKNFKIVVRDDGSSDNTLKILETYDGNMEILGSQKNIYVKKSFSTLLKYALKNNDNNYFMFCDQDDIWEKDKIEKTLKQMKEMEKTYGDIPLLVHTDLQVVDEKLKALNESFWKYEKINPNCNDLNRLLMQNTITGCTVMINRKLSELALPIPNECIMHDWWMGLVASQFGKILFIDEGLIKYRQHDSNSIGAKGFSYKTIFLKAYKNFYKNELYLKYLQINIEQAKIFLERYKDSLDSETIRMLKDFIGIESKSFWQKRKILVRYKFFKQGFIRNIGLFLKL